MFLFSISFPTSISNFISSIPDDVGYSSLELKLESKSKSMLIELKKLSTCFNFGNGMISSGKSPRRSWTQSRTSHAVGRLYDSPSTH